MVTNYLVGSVRPVIKLWYPGEHGVGVDNPWADRAHEQYQAMYQVSRDSARRFLQGPWEEICWSSPCLDARMFQIAQWYLLRELWFREPCNILYMGADTLFVKPTSIFGEYPEMRMFNYTDPPTHQDLSCYTTSGYYFNDDVRYLPHTMDPKIWDIGERHMIDWFHHAQAHWDCGQLINNHMFWAQDIDSNDRFRPELNWMFKKDQLEEQTLAEAAEWNHVPWSQVHIMHFTGSRGAGLALDLMQQVYERSQP